MQFKTRTVSDHQLLRTEPARGPSDLMSVTELLNADAKAGWDLVTVVTTEDGKHVLIQRK